TDYYNIEKEITALGTGEALITALNEDGRPTPLVRTLLRAPESRMDILTQQEITEIINHSALIPKYNKSVNKESAAALLERKMCRAQSTDKQHELRSSERKAEHETAGAVLSWVGARTDAVDTSAGGRVRRPRAGALAGGLVGVLGGKSSV